MKDKPEIVVDEERQGTLRACVAKGAIMGDVAMEFAVTYDGIFADED
jgi:hypothetical protein